MVTKLSDGRGQTTLKGREIDDEWEALIRKAAERTKTTIAGFIVTHTTPAAQAILKNEPVGPVALPVRMEDIALSLEQRMAVLAEEQRASLERIERASRRGRWARR